MKHRLLSVLGCLAIGVTWTVATGHCPAAGPSGPSMRLLIEADWIARDRDFRPGKTVATTAAKPPAAKAAQPVTTAEDAAGGCDGIKNGLWGFHVASGEKEPWWQVDLGKPQKLDRAVVYNRTDSGKAPRTNRIRVLVADSDGPDADTQFREVALVLDPEVLALEATHTQRARPFADRQPAPGSRKVAL